MSNHLCTFTHFGRESESKCTICQEPNPRFFSKGVPNSPNMDRPMSAYEMAVKEDDPVNHPKHYTKGIEVLDFIESWGLGFCLGNTIKYVCRSPYKGTELQDLKKARFYLDRKISELEEK